MKVHLVFVMELLALNQDTNSLGNEPGIYKRN